MKRLIPAAIIFVLIILMCISSNRLVKSECQKTLTDVRAFHNKELSYNSLKNKWQQRKEKMSIFVNHNFLDKISIYISELDPSPATNEKNAATLRNIEAVLSLVVHEEQLGQHSFY